MKWLTLFVLVFASLGASLAIQDLDRYLLNRGVTATEGHSSEEERAYFQNLIRKNPHVKRVLEVGFNAGHSAVGFLTSSEEITVHSFDLGDHWYVEVAKQFIDQTYPGRHVLVLGDSAQTVPMYHNRYPQETFDLIFIDGDHSFDMALGDLLNLKKFAHKDTIVIMDDLLPHRSYGLGPSLAWELCIERGIIEHWECGFSPCGGTGWGVGRYTQVD